MNFDLIVSRKSVRKYPNCIDISLSRESIFSEQMASVLSVQVASHYKPTTVNCMSKKSCLHLHSENTLKLNKTSVCYSVYWIKRHLLDNPKLSTCNGSKMRSYCH